MARPARVDDGSMSVGLTPWSAVPTAHADLPALVDLADDVAVVAGSTPVSSIDRMFRRDPELHAVAVDAAQTLALLSRQQVNRELDGRLGYGRALHSRSTAVDLLPEERFVLDGHLNPIEAAQRILQRHHRHRYHDVLIVTDAGPRVLSVSRVFECVSSIYHHVALHDPLTGLPNRRLLDQQGTALVEQQSDVSQVAILYIDLDGFKAINDAFGHRVGDDILISFAERLRTCVRPDDIVARLGGDEFAALLCGTTDVQAEAIADRIVLSASAPFVHDEHLIHLSATVGVAMASDIATETELTQLDVLLRHADGAMLKAKDAGKRRVGRLDTRRGSTPFARQSAIRRRLLVALENGDFSLHYQPKLDLVTEDLGSVEALIRWNDVELGAVSPAEFIPIAETSDDIHRIGRWVIGEACAQARAWMDAGTSRTIAINVSPKQFTTGTLVDELLDEISGAGISTAQICIEITEGSAIADLPNAISQLTRLRESGVDVDLDDFGTGYSSLEMLRQLPLSAVKVDKAFIDNLDTSRADALMIRGVIDAAHALGLRVIAEGVERATQLVLLRELGCDAAQGYFISRPVAAGELARSACAAGS
jgi:diguanylate cyclase (GGDEF)-like protein